MRLWLAGTRCSNDAIQVGKEGCFGFRGWVRGWWLGYSALTLFSHLDRGRVRGEDMLGVAVCEELTASQG